MRAGSRETKLIHAFFPMFRDDIPCTTGWWKTEASVFGYAGHVTVTFVICQHRGLLIGLHPIDPPRGTSPRLARFLSPDPFLLFTSRVTPMEFIRNPGRARYRNTQSICMLAHTYVRGACNTWGYNTRDESALSENARGLHTGLAPYLCIYVSHPHIHMPPILDRSMGYLEMGPGIM